mmetsp:Transcript_90720/g.189634  ORF Transcript_90720/g.189634 Transcript_90720/m.189634 type:complete len:238 (-) Transcript_90720:384-1097(-)
MLHTMPLEFCRVVASSNVAQTRFVGEISPDNGVDVLLLKPRHKVQKLLVSLGCIRSRRRPVLLANSVNRIMDGGFVVHFPLASQMWDHRRGRPWHGLRHIGGQGASTQFLRGIQAKLLHRRLLWDFAHIRGELGAHGAHRPSIYNLFEVSHRQIDVELIGIAAVGGRETVLVTWDRWCQRRLRVQRAEGSADRLRWQIQHWGLQFRAGGWIWVTNDCGWVCANHDFIGSQPCHIVLV